MKPECIARTGARSGSLAIYDKCNDLAGFEGTMEDITGRKKAEEALEEVREAERSRI